MINLNQVRNKDNIRGKLARQMKEFLAGRVLEDEQYIPITLEKDNNIISWRTQSKASYLDAQRRKKKGGKGGKK